MSTVRVRLGTRGSQLALAQARYVAQMLQSRWPDVEPEIVRIRTSGDASTAPRLGPELGSSFFTKEIEDALLGGRIDLAVHSCKDLASTSPEGLALVAVPERENPYDVLVSAEGRRLGELPSGASIGTSSVRRRAHLSHARPDLQVRDLRGNLPTRLRAVDHGAVDAVMLAAAGLQRLGLSHRITELLGPPLIAPAAGQGALAIQARAGDTRVNELVSVLDHGPSHAEVEAERACLRGLSAGCQAPVGVLARAHGAVLRLGATVAAPERIVRTACSGDLSGAEAIGEHAAAELLAQLALSSLDRLSLAGPPPGAADGASSERMLEQQGAMRAAG